MNTVLNSTAIQAEVKLLLQGASLHTLALKSRIYLVVEIQDDSNKLGKKEEKGVKEKKTLNLALMQDWSSKRWGKDEAI